MAEKADSVLDLNKLNFEEALEKLEILVAQMEEGNLPLDQMLNRFEQGMKLTSFCRRKLEKLEKRIEVLTSDDGESGEWDEFDENSARKEAAHRQSTAPSEDNPQNNLF
ncbi:MAG: exodeoxyribonuclease VII small subunit [Victivallaceae bacterium]|nr:exodeoxyribonuclease VII small subunit [Victivallaceae bacterium]